MVSGIVSPPRIDLTNRDLIQSHLHAVWLAETSVDFGRSMTNVINLDSEGLDLQPSVQSAISNERARTEAIRRSQNILGSIHSANESNGFTNDWVTNCISQAPAALDRAAQRWRDLYQAARQQQVIQNKRRTNHALTPDEQKRAASLRFQAERQLEILRDEDRSFQGDFYPYRYFASEGFLPGYNFPRLPLAAFIPSQTGFGATDGEYLQRPRFIAISEFGPRNSIYYEGNRYRVESVTLPIRDGDSDDITTSIKVCRRCGYVHEAQNLEADICQNPDCGASLADALHQHNFLRLRSVNTRRMERITSEEEERQRQGYELQTAIRFHDADGVADVQRGTLRADGLPEIKATYAPAATIWRINLGWRRRTEDSLYGFWLDTVNGRWSSNDDPYGTGDADDFDEQSQRNRRVIPYVDDNQNALLMYLQQDGLHTLQNSAQATLNYQHGWTLAEALKRGICITYQLEENEIAVELLPEHSDNPAILFTETSEGGAGVLRNMLERPSAFAEVCNEALGVLHFDQSTGEDLEPHTCGIACYQCLLSYSNQRLHESFNRHLVRDALLHWSRSARLDLDASHQSREDQRGELLERADSSLEREFIDWLYVHRFRLPDSAQQLIESATSRPDFAFRTPIPAVVFVDGPVHQFADTAERDELARRKLRKLGYRVVVFTTPDNWEHQIAPHSDIFGEGDL